MKPLLFFVLIAALSGCGGGVWRPDWRADEMTVYWIRVPQHRLAEFCGTSPAGPVQGCARQKSPQSCTVYAPEPEDDIDNVAFAVLGEEVAHCFYGDFHE